MIEVRSISISTAGQRGSSEAAARQRQRRDSGIAARRQRSDVDRATG